MTFFRDIYKGDLVPRVLGCVYKGGAARVWMCRMFKKEKYPNDKILLCKNMYTKGDGKILMFGF